MSQRRDDNDDEGDSSGEEESYYEEVSDDSGSEFEFAELEKELYARSGGPPAKALAVMGKNAASFTPTPPAEVPVAVKPAAAPAAPARPPHPLFGGGGADGGRNALLDQIKARGEGGKASSSAPPKAAKAPALPVAPRAAPPPPKPKPAAQLSMAEQVALMAAKRAERMQEGDSAPAATASVPPTNVTTTAVVAAPPAPVPVAKPAVTVSEPVKKSGGFFGKREKKQETKIVVTKPASVVVPTPAGAEPTEPAFIKSYKPEPLPVPTKAAPQYSQARLKSTGIREDSPAAQLEDETSPQQPEAAPLPITTSTTTTTTTTKTKRVTKSNPEYDVTEYKVGCACTVM